MQLKYYFYGIIEGKGEKYVFFLIVIEKMRKHTSKQTLQHLEKLKT